MNQVSQIYPISPTLLGIQIDIGTVQRGFGADPDIFRGRPLNNDELYGKNNYTLTSSNDGNVGNGVNPIDISFKAKTTDVAFLDKFQTFNSSQLNWTQRYDIFLTLPENKALKPGKTYQLNFDNQLNNDINDVQRFRYNPRSNFSEAVHVSQIGFDPGDPKVAFLSQWLGQRENGAIANNPESLKSGLRFWIVDAATNQRVENNSVVRRTQLASRANSDEDIRDNFQNYSGTDVYELEFSDFNTPGEYYIEVAGVGRSFDFEIAENTWERAFQVSMKGLYNQRAGTAIGGPFSDSIFPRSIHPADGANIFPTDDLTTQINGQQVTVNAVQLIDTSEGLNLGGPALDQDGDGNVGFIEAFDTYIAPFDRNGNGEVTANELARNIDRLQNAWGGYKDAGDWDRRIQHLFGTRLHLELLEIFPDYFETVDLNIPETTNSYPTLASLNRPNPENGLPDILDESLWSLDFYRRLQNPDGGIRGGIEFGDFPDPGETSWNTTVNFYAYAADPWSSYIYAGVAARAAKVLKAYDQPLARQYERSAIRAMNWAEAERGQDSKYDVIEIRDERNLAALELYLLTEDSKWNDIFLEDTVFQGSQCGPGEPCFDVAQFEVFDQQQAAFLYARAPRNLTNNQIQRNTQKAIERAAENSISFQQGGPTNFFFGQGPDANGTGFRWTKGDPYVPIIPGLLATPQVDKLLQAHVLTGEQRFLDAAVLGSQYSAGANPENLVYTAGLKKIGLADREIQNPYVYDARETDQDAPAGITAYGPVEPAVGFSNFQTTLFDPFTTPRTNQRPLHESFFDNYWNFQNAEFTIHQSIAPTAYAWGYFAASDFEPGQGQVLTGSNGPDMLVGQEGDDTISGADGADKIIGNAGNDRLFGGSGNDRIQGNAGRDQLAGGFGNDRLMGGFSSDRISGGPGQDTLKGDAGNDTLSGGKDNDKVIGGDGADRISGQAGFDILTGGAGRDVFILARNQGRDRIRDFEDGVDRIGLGRNLSFTQLSLQQQQSHVAIFAGGQALAILANTRVNQLSTSDFISI